MEVLERRSLASHRSSPRIHRHCCQTSTITTRMPLAAADRRTSSPLPGQRELRLKYHM
eukprot:CAMPEP_0194773792 /NCGR_PEP_ID=MMETSP0323_2-20130528/55856_1 /TAXON_ID=2866 ORGANISM="Crypthecodinium cohnii, Strain Seligo" /NCGR_SAMPLE_ID=MMETSP0323_2 /ASSEMBLY_ACC=CAM_ASM_000346 /LENGTH=57 /DNA_ID=CAMNT_0039709023 /DNA_START=80 /DNA_END=253 /DNA_ORIENTATION=-